MDVDLGRSIDRYVDVLVADHVLGNDGAANRGSAIAAIDVDTHTAGRRRVGCVGEVSGNRIEDDFVSTHIIGRKAKCRSYMRVQGDASQSIVYERVPNDHVI